MKIDQASKTFLAYSQHTKKLSPLTIKAYQQDLTLLSILTKNRSIRSIKSKKIIECVNKLFAKGETNSTVKRRLACYKCFFKWLEHQKLIKQTPFYNLDLKIKLPQRLPRNLNQVELKQLLKTSKKNLGISPRDSYINNDVFLIIDKTTINELTLLLTIELLFTTGLRISELSNITLDDIHLESRYIQINGKGQRERRVFITNESIKELLTQYLTLRLVTLPSHDVLLVNRQGKPATPQTIRIWLRKLSSSAKISRRATPHMYRHSAATSLIDAGLDIRYVQKLLGHQSITTTQIYTHVSNSELFQKISNANIQEKIL